MQLHGQANENGLRRRLRSSKVDVSPVVAPPAPETSRPPGRSRRLASQAGVNAISNYREWKSHIRFHSRFPGHVVAIELARIAKERITSGKLISFNSLRIGHDHPVA